MGSYTESITYTSRFGAEMKQISAVLVEDMSTKNTLGVVQQEKACSSWLKHLLPCAGHCLGTIAFVALYRLEKEIKLRNLFRDNCPFYSGKR